MGGTAGSIGNLGTGARSGDRGGIGVVYCRGWCVVLNWEVGEGEEKMVEGLGEGWGWT